MNPQGFPVPPYGGVPRDHNRMNSSCANFGFYTYYADGSAGMNYFPQANCRGHQQQNPRYFPHYWQASAEQYNYEEWHGAYHQVHHQHKKRGRGRGRVYAPGRSRGDLPDRSGTDNPEGGYGMHGEQGKQTPHGNQSQSNQAQCPTELKHAGEDHETKRSQTSNQELKQPKPKNGYGKYYNNSSSSYAKREYRKSACSSLRRQESRDEQRSNYRYSAGTKCRNLKQGTQEDIESQRGVMIDELYNNSYECMVCCDVIHHDVAVWNCTSCYHIFHLRCIKKWARSSTAAEGGSTGWRCPACQNITEKYPSQYRCFCGKVTNPQASRHDTPHSCGEVCGKKRPRGCVHPCNILCHPGPCPPCHASVTKSCDCQKTKQVVKCGQGSNVKCTQKCEKILNCGRHTCQQLCHSGSCDPCDEVIEQVCFCGKSFRTVSCGSAESFESTYLCKHICDRTLSCGKHTCDKLCHPGVCDDCKLLPSVITQCPCGNVKLSEMSSVPGRTSCTDPVPTCGGICNKELNCGPKDGPHHLCQRQCHTGACGPCQGTSEVTCRCGRQTKEMTCVEAAAFTEENPFLCETRCIKKRQCGRHKCGKLCCVDTEHKCDQLCGRKLSCGLHRCEEPCHRGNCPVCWQVSFDELRCHCGAEVIYPPVPCGTKAPECTKPCTRPQACGHPVRHNCHIEDTCPLCTELTEKWCHGKHELRRNIHCYQKEVSCGMPCNKPLPCGIHKCEKVCHKGDCLADDEVCTQPCPRPRTLCDHPCAAPCHGSDPCPSVVCKAEVNLRCECGNREERGLCLMGGDSINNDFLRMETSMLALTMASAKEGETVDISVLMKELNRKKPRKLECTSQCSMKERNKRLALALEIKNPDISGKLGNPTYTSFLKDYAKQYPTFVAGIEQELSKLVNMSQQSKQPKRSHAFKPMNAVQRRVVHELTEYYGCETQSYDEEPNKNVVATAYRSKCWHPTVSLTQLIQRELHPKAPTPIPHCGKEANFRSSGEPSRKITSVSGAWGKPPSPTSTTSNSIVSRLTSWSEVTTATSSKTTGSVSNTRHEKPGTTTSLKEKTTDKKNHVIDYFDMVEGAE